MLPPSFARFRSTLCIPAVLLATAFSPTIFATPLPAVAAVETKEADVDFVPTPMAAVRRMLEMAQVGPDDHVVDLGSGDGRILITAAVERGVQSAIGIELDPWLTQFATEKAEAAGVGDHIRFVQGDLFNFDFSEAEVLTMFLLPKLNLQLRPYILERLEPGTRVVSHAFDMGDWAPDQQDQIHLRPVFLWIVPAQVAGVWTVSHADAPPLRLSLEQKFQRVVGRASRDGTELSISDVTLTGREIRFSIQGREYAGRADGNTIQATGDGNWSATRQ